MRKFIATCKLVRDMYPTLWNHSRIENRRIMVQYWLPIPIDWDKIID